MTQQSASSSEELAATSEEMSSQAEELQRLMDFFRVEQSNVTDLTRRHAGPSKATKRVETAPRNGGKDIASLQAAARAVEDEEPLAKAVGAEDEFVRF